MVACSRLRPWLQASAMGLALLVGTPICAQPLQVLSEDQSTHGGQLMVPLNKSQVLKIDRPFAQALIGNQEIADVLPLTNQSLYVLGKQPGTTSLTLYDRGKSLIAVVDVVVGPDVISLRRELSELIPGDRVGTRLSNGSVVLTGTVSSGPAAQRAAQIAETYAPGKVINMLSVGSTQQVMLEVRFSEVRRAAARQLGINTSFLSDSGTVFGGTGERASSTTLLTNQNGKPTIDIGGILDTFGIVAAGTSLGGLDLFGALDALERRGIVTTLAEPTLIALSGETASFLAGGEFPIPVLQGSGGGDGSSGGRGITVEFKPFGVSLAFTPTVLEDGIISLEVSPEVSSIDTASSISVNGLSIPGLQVRRARTTLELRDGQSFAMAGLLRRDFRDTVRQFPILGSIPIIGALFRSTGFQKEETELVIIVTPRLVRPMRAGTERLPTDTVEQPNDLELFLLGKSEKRGSSSGRQPTPTAPVGATGIEGPSGHILEDGK